MHNIFKHLLLLAFSLFFFFFNHKQCIYFSSFLRTPPSHAVCILPLQLRLILYNCAKYSFMNNILIFIHSVEPITLIDNSMSNYAKKWLLYSEREMCVFFVVGHGVVLGFFFFFFFLLLLSSMLIPCRLCVWICHLCIYLYIYFFLFTFHFNIFYISSSFRQTEIIIIIIISILPNNVISYLLTCRSRYLHRNTSAKIQHIFHIWMICVDVIFKCTSSNIMVVWI